MPYLFQRNTLLIDTRNVVCLFSCFGHKHEAASLQGINQRHTGIIPFELNSPCHAWIYHIPRPERLVACGLPGAVS